MTALGPRGTALRTAAPEITEERRFDRGERRAAPDPDPAAAIRRLAAAPAMRNRLLELLSVPRAQAGEIAIAAESDPALVLAVLCEGGAGVSDARRRPTSVAGALQCVSRKRLRDAVSRVSVFDVFGPRDPSSAYAERLRYHALSTHRIAEHVEKHASTDADPGALAAVALLHDFGKLALAEARPSYRDLERLPATVEQRLALERRNLGTDHALVGGAVARRLGLAEPIAIAIEHHHDELAGGCSALVRVADMLSHHLVGQPVDRRQLMRAAHAVGLGPDQLSGALEELPIVGEHRVARVDVDLSVRQVQILRELAKGRRYRGIADELGISESTIRTHLHLLYKKLGVRDRAQAVLLAANQGWL